VARRSVDTVAETCRVECPLTRLGYCAGVGAIRRQDRIQSRRHRAPSEAAPSVASATMPVSRVLFERLNSRRWQCDKCRGVILRGEPIRVVITRGASANHVEHDPVCPKLPAQ
jgi:hypothetical protein